MYTNVGEGEDEEEMKMQWSNGAMERGRDMSPARKAIVVRIHRGARC